jgi:DNA topoisomerase I
VQLGEVVNGEKPKRAGLLRGMQAADIDLDTALKLLSLPREIGHHPEDGAPVIANNGRFGPYVQHGKTYANVEAGDDLFHIGLNRAVTLIADKIAKGPRGRRFGGDPGRPLGEHPDKGGPVVVKAGRYGPYVSHDGINATLPRDKAPETVTLEEALPLLAARAEQIANGAGRKPSRRKTGKASAKSVLPDQPGGKTAKPAAAKPVATKPAAKPTKTSVAKSAKPVRPGAKSADKSAGNSAGKSAGKSAGPAGRKAAAKSANKRATKPAAPKVPAKRPKGPG